MRMKTIPRLRIRLEGREDIEFICIYSGAIETDGRARWNGKERKI